MATATTIPAARAALYAASERLRKARLTPLPPSEIALALNAVYEARTALHAARERARSEVPADADV